MQAANADALSVETPATGDVGPYRLEATLGSGTMGVVYRACHRESGERVALKMARGIGSASLAGVRREIHALGQLAHPGVVRIVAQGLHVGLPWFAMELLEGPTLRDRLAAAAAEDAPPRASLLVALAHLCQPLAYIHERGVVHGDLKPGNVQFGPTGAPVLVDFGLFTRWGGRSGREVLAVGGVLSGTVSYMAPEQIRGELVDARADLYALGCMLYEAITGAPPFVDADPRAVLWAHLEHEPVPPSARTADVPPWLDDLVLTLLRKSRRERLGYADVAAATLAEHLGEAGHAAMPRRPSVYLYRSELVGREDVVGALVQAFDAGRAGRGRLLFLQGESGVGKTRLATEAATLAAERGMAVVLGECMALASTAGVESIAGSALHPFRPLLRAVADRCRDGGAAETDRLLGARGPVLAPYEPALATLPGQYRFPPPPDVSPEAAVERVLGAVVATLSAFAGTTPLVVLLDDLQWADALSLQVLAALQRGALDALPVVVLGTCRSEELEGPLRTIVERAAGQTLTLERLDEEGIRRIVGDMLALPAASPDFVRALFGHAEGNPFFVSQYLHVAVGERFLTRTATGRWHLTVNGAPAEASLSGRLPIPRSVQDLVRRRLAALTPSARALAETASILGPSFPESLLTGLGLGAETAVMEAVQELVRRRLVVRDGRGGLGFAHGKIREVTYDGVPPASRPFLHERAARAIEMAAPESGLAHQEGALAYHWSRAADRAPAESVLVAKALAALDRAGEHAMASHATDEAVRDFTEALRLATRNDGAPADAARQARWERRLGEAYYRLGNPAKARAHLERALTLMGERLPQGHLDLAGRLVAEVTRQAGRRWLGRGPRGVGPAPDAAHAYELLSFVQLLMMEWLPSLVSNLRCLNAVERAGASPTLANGAAVLGMSAGVLLGPRLARRYFALGLETARDLGDDYCRGRVAHMLGFHSIGQARWHEAERALQEAHDAFERCGDGRWRDSVVLTTANLHYYHHRVGGLRLYRDGGRASEARGDAQSQAWAALGTAVAHLASGAHDEALASLGRMQHLLGGELSALGDLSSELDVHGIRAAASWRSGRPAEAAAAVAEARPLTAGSPLLLYHALAGYGCLSEVALRLWEGGTDGGRFADAALAHAADRALADLAGFARFFPFARPTLAVHRGVAHWLSGRPRRARSEWRRALAVAMAYDMPAEEGLAHFEIGRHLPSGDPARARHLGRACQLFEGIGARYDAALAEAALGSGTVTPTAWIWSPPAATRDGLVAEKSP